MKLKATDTDERDGRFLLDAYSVITYPQTSDAPKWFVSFGSLLWYIRDRNQGKRLEGDLDVSLFEPVNARQLIGIANEFRFKLLGQIINDVTGAPFQIVLKHETGRVLDLYFWHETKKYYWHTYDFYNRGKKIPSEYVFKATPKRDMDGDVWKYLVCDRIPEFHFPHKYGALLDIWYPGWYVPDSRFGQSHAAKTVEIKSCKKIGKLDEC